MLPGNPDTEGTCEHYWALCPNCTSFSSRGNEPVEGWFGEYAGMRGKPVLDSNTHTHLPLQRRREGTILRQNRLPVNNIVALRISVYGYVHRYAHGGVC